MIGTCLRGRAQLLCHPAPDHQLYKEKSPLSSRYGAGTDGGWGVASEIVVPPGVLLWLSPTLLSCFVSPPSHLQTDLQSTPGQPQ